MPILKVVTLCCALCCASDPIAVSCDIEGQVAEVMENAAKGSPADLKGLREAHNEALLPFLYSYLGSDNEQVTQHTVILLSNIFQNLHEPGLRQEVVVNVLSSVNLS